jgi:hypothetical protein
MTQPTASTGVAEFRGRIYGDITEKDRIGVAMIDAAEKAGKIKPSVSTSSSRPRVTPASASPSWGPRAATR